MSHGEVFPKLLLILFSQDFDLLNKLTAKKSSQKNVKLCAAAFILCIGAWALKKFT